LGHSGLSGHSGHSGHSQRLRNFESYLFFRERVYPTEETEYNFLVDIGFDDYYLKIQQYLTMEVENHEDGISKFIRSEIKFGRCPEKIEEPCTKTIEDSKAFCDDGVLTIKLPLCALEEQRIIPSDLFMSKKLISLFFT
jgi:HSP20 family molecular chaperone IbpA